MKFLLLTRQAFVYLSKRGVFKTAWFIASPFVFEVVRDAVEKTKFKDKMSESFTRLETMWRSHGQKGK